MWNSFMQSIFGETGDTPNPQRVPTQRVPTNTANNAQASAQNAPLSTTAHGQPVPVAFDTTHSTPQTRLPSRQEQQPADDDDQLASVLEASREEYRNTSAQQHRMRFESFCQKLQLSMTASLMGNYDQYIQECVSSGQTFKNINFDALNEAFDSLDELEQANVILYFSEALEELQSSYVNQFNLFLGLHGEPREALLQKCQEYIQKFETAAESLEHPSMDKAPALIEDDEEGELRRAIELSRQVIKESEEPVLAADQPTKDNTKIEPVIEPIASTVTKIDIGPTELRRIRCLGIDLRATLGSDVGAITLIQNHCKWDDTLSVEAQRNSLKAQEELVAAFRKAPKDKHNLEGLKDFIAHYGQKSAPISPITNAFDKERQQTLERKQNEPVMPEAGKAVKKSKKAQEKSEKEVVEQSEKRETRKNPTRNAHKK